jgi:hypothetical protein
MATHDYVIDNSTGANVRADINSVLQAILTNNSSSSAPSTTAAYMWWADTTNGVLKIRNSANNAWIELFQLDGTLTLEDGSASTPALAFRDDLDTGIFSAGANSFNVATGGTERMQLGATTVFNESGADVDFRVESDTNTHAIFLNAANSKVGINTSSPNEALEVTGDVQVTSGGIKVTGATPGIRFTDTADTGGFGHVGVNNASGSLVMRSDDGNALSGTFMGFEVDSGEKMRIDSSGRLGINTSSPNQLLEVANSSGGATISISTDEQAGSQASKKYNNLDFTGYNNNVMARIQSWDESSSTGHGYLTFFTNKSGVGFTEKLRIDPDGNLLIGTTSTGYYSNNLVLTAGNGGGMTIAASSTSDTNFINFADAANSGGYLMGGILYQHSTNVLAFRANDAERMRIKSSGDVSINNTGDLDTYRLAGAGSSVRGHLIRADGNSASTVSQQQASTINRLDSDGTLITFSRDGSLKGSISVSSGTVSVIGAHLSRWSQMKGLSTTDKSARPTIYQGTVMSNLDDLCEWTYSDFLYKEDVLYTNKDTIPEGKSVGDVKHAKGSVLRAAYTEENMQLNMTKISDTEGDKDVAGVFWTWDDEDDEIVNDFYIAMTGDMVIRVAASTTVARGDLLISAGDGTAKPQADDIIRSSTIAKIISINHTATYADGSKAYPCVLMAC